LQLDRGGSAKDITRKEWDPDSRTGWNGNQLSAAAAIATSATAAAYSTTITATNAATSATTNATANTATNATANTTTNTTNTTTNTTATNTTTTTTSTSTTSKSATTKCSSAPPVRNHPQQYLPLQHPIAEQGTHASLLVSEREVRLMIMQCGVEVWANVCKLLEILCLAAQSQKLHKQQN